MEHLNIRICEYLNVRNSSMVLFTVSADARFDTHQVKLARRQVKKNQTNPKGSGSFCTG